MSLHNAIQQANQKGNLGLILYVVPHFPDPDTYREVAAFLEQNELVSIVESTYPTTRGFSEHANDTIRRAHLTASAYASTDLNIRTAKPTLLVLYRGTLADADFEGFLSDHKKDFDGLILEWSEPEEHIHVRAANRQGVELVQCVGPWMDEVEMERILQRCLDQPLIYLMSAAMTGAELFANAELERCIQFAKEVRPKAKVAAGFGVRTAEDIDRLSRVEGLDAVIVGTEFLLTAERGLPAVRDKLEEYAPALCLNPKTGIARGDLAQSAGRNGLLSLPRRIATDTPRTSASPIGSASCAISSPPTSDSGLK